MKILVAAAIAGLALSAMKGDERQTYIVGDPAWLATEKCSFSDRDLCAGEAQMKALLRKGPVKVEG